jgi:hypothetical protein
VTADEARTRAEVLRRASIAYGRVGMRSDAERTARLAEELEELAENLVS